VKPKHKEFVRKIIIKIMITVVPCASVLGKKEKKLKLFHVSIFLLLACLFLYPENNKNERNGIKRNDR
jgi:hypothetical protein